MAGILQTVFELLGTLLVVIIMFFLAWYLTRLIARGGVQGVKGRHLTVLEKITVGKDSAILLVRTFEKVLIIGVTPGGMTVLREMDEKDVDLSETQTNPQQNFREIFSKSLTSVLPDGKVRRKVEEFLKAKKGSDDNDAQAR